MLRLMPGCIDNTVGPIPDLRVTGPKCNSDVAPLRFRFSALGLILIACIFLGANGALGQGLPGILPFSTNENGVDLATGNVNMAFPLRAKNGKIPFWSKVVATSGMAITYTGLYYQWQPMLIYPGYKYQDPTTISFAYKVVPPTVANCPYGTNSFYHAEYVGDFAVVDSTGAAHSIPGNWKVGNGPAGSACQTQQGTSGPTLTYDGSGYSLVITNGNLTAYDRNGNSWTGSCTYSLGCVLGSSTGGSISDPDGTKISESDGTVTDSLAATVLSNVPYNGAKAASVSYVDANGNTQQYVLTYTSMNIATNFNCINSAGAQGPVDQAPAALEMLTSITIPTPTPTKYTITYEPTPGKSGYFTGRIAEISLPTGGSISYSYSGGNEGINCTYGTVPTLTVTVNNGNGNNSIFTYASNLSTAVVESSVPFVAVNFGVTKTDPDSNQTVYSFQGEYQTSAQYYQGSATGTPLQAVVTCYNGSTSGCAAPSTEISLPITQIASYTSYNASSDDLVQKNYDTYGNVTSESDMDYGNVGSAGECASATSGVCKLTSTTFGSWNGSSCTALSTVNSVPCDVKIENNNTGAILAETRYTYNAAGHPTAISKWVSGSTWVTTNNTYNANGTLATTKDPNGNTTQFGYAATGSGGCNGVLLTSTTYPVAAMGSSSQTWNCGGGVIASTIDVNKITTAYSYADPLDRLTLVESAVGALNWSPSASAQSDTAYTYPSLTQTDVAQDLTTTNDGLLTSETTYDGLGRTTKTVDRDGSVIETAYDPLSRVCAVSNPTFHDPGALSCTIGSNQATAATDGYTYFTYDALGRKTVQTQPDGSTQRWVYNGAEVDFYDEDNSHWEWLSDSLGRLTLTKENDPAGTGALTLVTNYTYDLLGDLLSVNQNGASGDTVRVRTFAYDGLSRLTNACNPESIASGSSCATSGPWSAAYTYDANGNVGKRTDARGIVTNYSYDAMNRVTAKSYTNDPANTPALTYGYDTEYPWQLTQNENNPIGHLNSIMATVGSTNLVTWTSGDYDQRGNLTGFVNCVGSNAQTCSGFGVGANISYDLNEDLTGFVESAGGATNNGQGDYIAYGYDNSGRLNSIATNLSIDLSGNTLTSTAFSGLTYYPGGAVETANLAIDPTSNVAGIALSRTYDNRGRITGETDTSSTGQGAYNYSVSYDGNSNVTGYNDSVNGSWTITNDALHRLTKSTGTMNGVAATFQETYDHFGNRNVEYFTYNGVQSQPSPYLNFTAGNNRAANSTYDNAGNLLSDGTNSYLYDAEDRLCAVQQATTGGDMIGYVYAADGPRLGKGNLTSFSCDVTKNGLLTANGLALSNAYMVGPQGERLEETDANFNGVHYNVFWEGKLLGTFTGTTYAQSNWHFALNDWVGTKRELTTSTGAPWTSLSSGPFGDYASQTGSGSNPSEEFFTSKVRDTESGLDDFLARHYSSNWGRFLSPDPESATPLRLLNPQRWNMYTYGLNNPLGFTDSGGRDAAAVNFSKEIAIVGHEGIMSVTSDGTVRYARFGPAGGARPSGPGQVQSFTLSTKVQFDSNNQPTADSLNAIKKELGTSDLSPEKGQDPSSIRLNYFKINDDETANLNQWITQQQNASDQGQAHHYNVDSTNCTWFCGRGLVAAGVLDQNQANHASPAPNGFYLQLLNLPPPCARTAATDSQGNTTGWSGCQ
jgi:RHS repeat-associated protein